MSKHRSNLVGEKSSSVKCYQSLRSKGEWLFPLCPSNMAKREKPVKHSQSCLPLALIERTLCSICSRRLTCKL